MKQYVTCPECLEHLEIGEFLNICTAKEIKQFIIESNNELKNYKYDVEILPIIPENLHEEDKFKIIKKLYETLTLEQLENLEKQFIKK